MRRSCRRWPVTAFARAAVVITAVLMVASSVPSAGGAPARASGVGVVDFYAAGSLPPVVGVVPEVLAADDLADLVARSGGGQVTVIPRATVRQAESALGWRGSDALRFARLRELARALDADVLLVGWIQRLDLDRGTSSGKQGGGDIRMLTGFATVTVQVFDPRQTRVLAQVEQSTYEIGILSSRVAERLIRRVVEETVPSILSAIARGR